MGKLLVCDAPGCLASFYLDRSDRIGGETIREAVKAGWTYGDRRDVDLAQTSPDLCPAHKQEAP